jgi:hypothetical protein
MTKYIVTAIYERLFGTELGGRPSRGDHYRHSLKSLSKMDDATFIIYTNDYDSLNEFIIENIVRNNPNFKYELKTYDIANIEFSAKINKNKNIEDTKNSFRCIELQYSKLLWLEDLAKITQSDDIIFWIDAGLSYSGLIPDKYLGTGGYHPQHYYSNLFTNNLFNNIVNATNDQIFCIGKENMNFFWDTDLPDKYYLFGKDRSYHIIAGVFGGKSQNVLKLCDNFRELCNTLLTNEHTLFSEENILTGLYCNNKELFHMEPFDIWWHENNVASNIGKEAGEELVSRAKSFYKILESFQ